MGMATVQVPRFVSAGIVNDERHIALIQHVVVVGQGVVFFRNGDGGGRIEAVEQRLFLGVNGVHVGEGF